jgi:hypothetical protein
MNPKIGLVYLNRSAEGDFPVRRFIKSYKTFAPGIDHEFVTIYKGFTSDKLDVERGKFKDIEHRQIIVDDEMTDIDSYLITAESLSDIDIMCFLNTFSEITSENWLLYLSKAINRENVGIVGATASYESLLNSLKLIAKVVWLCDTGYLKYNHRLYTQYKTQIHQNARRWLAKNLVHWLSLGLTQRTFDYEGLAVYDDAFNEYWASLTSQEGVFSFLNGYPPFPNPNIRTNGFMVYRDHLSPFFNRSKGMTKNESYLFESGPGSLTSQILNKGLKAVVVNSYGEMFDVDEWPKSCTFRLGQQKKLLFRDNQTRSFERLGSAERDVLAYMTWGTSLNYSPERVFTFGIPFGCK